MRNKEEWLLFPSSDATSRVNQLAVEFDLYKQSFGVADSIRLRVSLDRDV